MTNTFYFGAPRDGKTYVVTEEALDVMKAKRAVLSNYPIEMKDGTFSQIWEPDYVRKNIQKSFIVIDEAQRDYDSQEHKSLDEDEDEFFATSGHNSNEIRVISQGVTRVTKAIRDRMNMWVLVRKVLDIPFMRNREGRLGRPLLFSKTTWLAFEDIGKKDKVYTHEYVWFKTRTARAYNTHYFQKEGDPFKPPSWREIILQKGGTLVNTPKKSRTVRLTGLSALAYRYLVPQRIKNTIHDADVLRAISAQDSKGSKIQITDIHEDNSPILDPGILPGPHPGGQRQRASPGDYGRLPADSPDPRNLDAAKSWIKQAESAARNKIQNLLPGNDQADKSQQIQPVQRVDLARLPQRVEADHQDPHTLGPRKPDLELQQEDCYTTLAGTYKKTDLGRAAKNISCPLPKKR